MKKLAETAVVISYSMGGAFGVTRFEVLVAMTR
jgi:hypothetical protein